MCHEKKFSLLPGMGPENSSFHLQIVDLQFLYLETGHNIYFVGLLQP